MRYPLLCLALLFNLFACVAFAQDDAVAKNLDAAKDRYDKALREWYTSVSNWLDQREEAARKESNNKTAELIKLDRQAFLDKDETPESLPNPLKQDISDARKTLIAAYETAIKEYTKASKDTEATAVEKELAAFKAKIAVSNGDPLRRKLNAAKATYISEMEKYLNASRDWFEHREEAARKDGNKKLVDQIKAEWLLFHDKGDLPKSAQPPLSLKAKSLRTALENSFTSVVKEYKKLKKDELATAAEKELKEVANWKLTVEAVAAITRENNEEKIQKQLREEMKPAVKLPEGYKLVWNDEFDGTKVDVEKWNLKRDNWVGHPVSKDSIYLDGKGHMILEIKKINQAVFGGLAMSNGKWKYGYFETRMRTQQLKGHFADFALLGDRVGWISIFHYVKAPEEPIGGKTIQFSHANGGTTNFVPKLETYLKQISSIKAFQGIGEDYHIHSLLWTEKECVFYLNGIEILRAHDPKINDELAIELLLSEDRNDLAAQDNRKPPYLMSVDYVRVFQKP